MSNLILSPKFQDFLTVITKREYLEGTTAAGKTTVGIPKFMLRVAMSNKKDHVLAGADLGTVEKNIINTELGILNQFENVTEYNPSGKGKIGLSHILYDTPNGQKVIYVVGYDNKARWKKVLGSQMGCVFIDEVNIADMEFLREISHRCDYMMTTSNPDDPNLDVYKEFINKSRPLKKYTNDYPKELLDELKEPHVKGWVHWYFTFYDNASMSEKDIQEKIESVPVGTKMYKNKIEGLRGRATGLVFSNFNKSNIKTIQEIYSKEQKEIIRKSGEYKFKQYSVGVDTSYSQQSEDTITFMLQGITDTGLLITLDEEVFNNKDTKIPFAPTDVVERLVSFLDRHREQGRFARTVYIDSADQATITEANKIKLQRGLIYDFVPAWKKLPIIDRINLQLGWIARCQYIVASHCKNHIRELNTYSWMEDKDNTPEDRNDHTINGNQYAWIPYKNMIGDMKG